MSGPEFLTTVRQYNRLGFCTVVTDVPREGEVRTMVLASNGRHPCYRAEYTEV